MEPLIVPGTLDSLEIIGQHVMQVSAQAGLDKKAAYNLRLGVDEIATNIILYGYEQTGMSGDVKIYTEITDQKLTLTLEDSARAYDPSNTPEPDLTLPLEERPMGGLGVYLAMSGADEFKYERVGNHNRNIFVMKRTAVPATSKNGHQ